MRLAYLPLLLFGALTVAGCGSSHRLGDYTFQDQSAAVLAAIPPRPAVFTHTEAFIDMRNPLRSALSAGTALFKEKEVREAQVRMDSALTRVDVAERLARRALLGSTRVLGLQPVNDPDAADFLLDIRVKDYGLVADSWGATVHFEVDADVVFSDRRTGEVVWRDHIVEREPVATSWPTVGGAFGNVYTAAALARLSVDEMVQALEHLADYGADQVVGVLRDDYYKSR